MFVNRIDEEGTDHIKRSKGDKNRRPNDRRRVCAAFQEEKVPGLQDSVPIMLIRDEARRLAANGGTRQRSPTAGSIHETLSGNDAIEA